MIAVGDNVDVLLPVVFVAMAFGLSGRCPYGGRGDSFESVPVATVRDGVGVFATNWAGSIA